MASKTFTLKPKKKGQKAVSFRKGALHRALNVPIGKPIPASKRNAALSGRYGPKVKKMAVSAFKGILAAGRQTSMRRSKRQKSLAAKKAARTRKRRK